MKDINIIRKDARIRQILRDIVDDTKLQFKATVRSKYNTKVAVVKFTRFLNWEHLSVSYQDETPSWDFMQEMKEMFWNDDEVCIQLHPKAEDYINNHEHCLHIWRPLDKEIPTPPSIFVGFRRGKEQEDRELLKQMQIDLGSPLSEEELDMYVLQATNPKALQDKLKKMSLEDLAKLMKTF